MELTLFWITRERLSEAKLTPYEISNYSKDGSECHHNVLYWSNGNYVGLGPGAVSHVSGSRAGNPRAIAPYRRWIATSGHATLWRETLAARARLGETWWLGLRLSAGVQPAQALETAGLAGNPDPTDALVTRLVESGHLERQGERVCLTQHGIPVADAVAAEFLVAPSELD